jgi:hypothetical protein
MKMLHQWHWMSSALCLLGMLLLAITGITLNHASRIEARPVVTVREARLPETLLSALPRPDATRAPLPPALNQWLKEMLSVRVDTRAAEWSDGEIYLALPRPGGDAWLSVDLHSGEVLHEDTDRGLIAYLNDLHKGRHAGPVWRGFLDVLAAATVIFSLTGLLLLKLHAGRRPATWPVVGLGVVIPLLLTVLFVH